MAQQKKDPNNPSNVSAAYERMLPSWIKIQTVLDGTAAMRGAGDAYLPRHDNEHEDAYLERLNGNVLRNVTAQTLDSWVGRPFGREIVVNEDVPDAMIEHLTDIDLLGNDVRVFSRDWFREGIAKGVDPILIDYPRVDAQPDGRQRTDEDDRREGIRPYWVKLRPEQILAASGVIVQGREILQHVRIHQQGTRRMGFVEETYDYIRVLDLVPVFERPDDPTSPVVNRMRVQIWEQLPDEKTRRKRWQVAEEWLTGIDEIPMPIFYAGERETIMCARSVLEDLVDLNIRHWQSNSDQIAILTVTRFPILALSGGAPEDDELTIGPRQWLYCADARGRFYYVEHGGAAINAGKEDLDDLLEQMADYGAEFLKRRPTNTPFSSKAQDLAEATSPLQDAVIRFNDVLNQALYFHAKWMRLPDGGTITISTEFGPGTEQSAALTALQTMRKDRDISRAFYLKRMQELGVLPKNFDFAANDRALEKELERLQPPEREIDAGAPAANREEPDDGDEEDEDEESEE